MNVSLISSAAAQTLSPVAESSGSNLAVILILAALASFIAVLVIWHRRNPSSEAKALSDANAALSMALAKAHEAIEWAHSHVHDLISKVPNATKADTVPAADSGLAGPTAEQLAAVEKAAQAYSDAKIAAGMRN